MAVELTFTEALTYDPGKPGIDIGVKLSVADQIRQIDAKLDLMKEAPAYFWNMQGNLSLPMS